ncbi:MAG: hypothetical protein HEEMFOPI_00855 [Holosporales bacterium]
MIEFSRRVDVEKLVKQQNGDVDIAATEEECQRLQNRFKFLKIKNLSLKGIIKARDDAKSFRFKGVLKSEIEQECMETQKPVEELIEEKIEILIAYKIEDETNYSIDIEEIQDGFIDLGEIASQYLSLSASPYPLCKTF